MNNTKLRFKGFSFTANPTTLTIKQERNVALHNSPLSTCIVQDLGLKARVITGEGKLFGADVNRQFQRLYEAFSSNGAGILCIPDMKPINAVFVQVSVTAKPTPNLLSYKFQFVEVDSK